MKRVGKPVFFIVALAIVLLSLLSVFGISTEYADKKNVYVKGASDIRLGIDIRGGVDVTFTPPEGVDATKEQMASAEEVIKNRLVSLNITDSEVYTDYDKQRIIVRFPWKEDEANFNPDEAIKELGETAQLTFREGTSTDESGAPSGAIVLEGKDVKEASAGYVTTSSGTKQYVVSLKLYDSGKEKFAEVTTRLAGTSTPISIWMDNTLISYPKVDEAITNGEAQISGSFTAETATELASKINAGALPFALVTENFSTIDPTLGSGALDAMLLAGGIALLLVCAFMIFKYRLPAITACIALVGQIAGTIAATSGFFPFVSSFTLTLPGIAGVILAVGMGVDANIIAAERIKEEIRLGKTIDTSVRNGFKKAFSAVLDGNITIIIVSIVLLGAFGPPGSFFNTILSPVFFMFGPSTAGSIYSFGYTLLVGVVLNFIMGVGASQLMLKSISRFKCFRSPWLYGGKRGEK